MAAMFRVPRPLHGAARAVLACALALAISALALNCGGRGGDEAPSASIASIRLVPAFPGLPALKQPVGLVEAPGHDLWLIVLLDGLVLSIPRDGPWDQPRTVHDQLEKTVTGWERGLFAIALDPEFARNGYVYAYYSSAGRRNRLVRFATTGHGDSLAFDSASELLILEVDKRQGNHNGGALAFGDDGTLWLSIGDGGDEWAAQDRATLPGSIIRIDVRGATTESPYRVPPDNPFVEEEGARPELWAWGLRNPWRFSIDRETGLVWTGDPGYRKWEEVNIVREGGNYGSPAFEGSFCSQDCGLDRFVPPVWEYGHSPNACAIIGGHVYRGDAIPALRGWYLFTDYCGGPIRALNAGDAAAGRAVDAMPLDTGGFDPPPSIVSFAEDGGGELYVISFGGSRIHRIVAP